MRQGMLRCLIAVGLLCVCPAALGKVSMRVEFGWEWMYQVGRWTPVFVTVSDSNAQPARNVRLEVYAPQDDLYAMRVFQQFAIGPEPATYILYVPLSYQIPDTVAILRDAQTGRKLAEASFEELINPGGGRTGNSYVSYGYEGLLIGVSGRRSGLGVLQGPFPWKEEAPSDSSGQYRPTQSLRVGYLEPGRLPDAKVGYESLDVLVLNGPDLVNMTAAQQAAIAGWVRGGGRLLMWAGQGPMPEDNAIVKLLPCRIGTITGTELSLAETKELGVAARVKNVAGRALEAAPGAKVVPILAGKIAACYGRAGLGTVGVLSVDGSQLAFDGRDEAVKFWRPILMELMRPSAEEVKGDRIGYQNVNYRKQRAMDGVAQRLGDVPGVGTFDFSYIAMVMIGMMLVVGPIDWFVLKKLGRQPWTWATTAGWIVLVTTGALYIGHVFRSGDLHYRTLRVIDQAEETVVGALDMAAIYSPRTQRYQLEVPRDGWWRPSITGDLRAWRNSSIVPREVPAVQDLRGNRPGGIVVNVWSLRFMDGALGDAAAEAPALEAKLRRIEGADSAEERIVGTIANRSGQTLEYLHIQMGTGSAALASPVKANETAMIDLPVQKDDSLADWNTRQHIEDARLAPAGVRHVVGAELAFAYAAGDLTPDRTDRIVQILKDEEDVACIVAIASEATATVKLRQDDAGPAKERHWQVIRALVAMERVEQP